MSIATSSVQQTPTTLAATIKAAADPLRLQILQVLGSSSYGVLELADIFDLRQSGMSHHLKVLANAQWVVSRREGNSIFYARNWHVGDLAPLQSSLLHQVDQLSLPNDIRQRIKRVQNERAKLSEEFFTKNAERFREQQDLIADFPSYGDTAEQVLSAHVDAPANLIVEVGPGAGEFLQPLGQLSEKVIGVDISPAMLNQAQQFCDQHQLGNVQLQEGDIHSLTQTQIHADVVVYNMVLHHVPDPAEQFLQSASLLSPGGTLLVTELCRHDQDWTRESVGDLWLGFDEQELVSWAKHAGLQHLQASFAGLRNGFQIQFQVFKKPNTQTD